MTWIAVPWIASVALAADLEQPSAHDVETPTAVAALMVAPPVTLAEGPPQLGQAPKRFAPRVPGWRAPLRRPRAQESTDMLPPVRDDRRRSRNLIAGALVAELAAGALLGGALVVKGSYEDSDEPTKRMYDANRIMGHAGYASAIAGGAMFLGSISMWEW